MVGGYLFSSMVIYVVCSASSLVYLLLLILSWSSIFITNPLRFLTPLPVGILYTDDLTILYCGELSILMGKYTDDYSKDDNDNRC